MSAARTIWRALATTLQIVALLAFVISSTCHAHAGVTDHGAAAVDAPSVGALGHLAGAMGQADHSVHCLDGSGPSGQRDGSKAHGPCSCTCTCQSALTGAAGSVLPSWNGRPVALRPPAGDAFSTLTPDIRPRPPRSFA